MADNKAFIREKSIWMASNVLKKDMSVEQILETLLGFTFLRRIDCLIEKSAKDCHIFYTDNRERLSDERLDKGLRDITGYPFYNYSGYSLEGIKLSNEDVEVILNSYLQGFSPNVKGILEGMNFMHTIAVLQRQPRLLVDMIEFFLTVDLFKDSCDDEDFIELVSSIIGFAGGDRGVEEHFTRPGLSDLICECLLNVDVRADKDEQVSIYDPTCGTGNMLAKAGARAKRYVLHKENVSLYGQELSFFLSAVAKAMVLLTGNNYSDIQYGNTLVEDRFSYDHFQYIIGDFPYGMPWKSIKNSIMFESVNPGGRYSLGLPVVGDSQFLFIEHIISKMDPAGSRAVFLSTASVLWSGNAKSGESRIRRWMFENDLVETIIALPSGTLTTTTIPIYLWILTNRKSKTQIGKVRLIDATSVARLNRRGGLDDNFVDTVVSEYKSKVLSTMSQIVANSQFGYYELNLLEDGEKSDTITISLDTDINDFIAKERQPFAKGEITVDYSSVEKGYSVHFEKFFKQEKKDVQSLVEATNELIPVIDAISSLKMDIQKIKGRTESKQWTEFPLRAVAQIVLGSSKPQTQNNEGLPLLSLAYLRNPSSDEDLYEVTPRTKCSSVKDVIMVIRGENAGEVFRGADGILSPSVAAIKHTGDSIILPQYMYYLLKGNEQMFRSLAKGVVIKSIDSKSILDVKCMVPPIEEQLRLVSYLDDIIGKIDNVLELIGSNDNAFSAYRQTLIENVVRGRVLIK